MRPAEPPVRYDRKKGGDPVAKSDAQICLRLPKQLKEELTAQAKRERRSVTALILRVMEEYLKNRESEK